MCLLNDISDIEANYFNYMMRNITKKDLVILLNFFQAIIILSVSIN